jgi:hypothetical protein
VAERAGEEEGEPPLWRFAPLGEANMPPEPAAETARRRWRQFLSHLWRSREPDLVADSQEQGGAMPASERQRWLPPLSYEQRADALRAELDEDGPGQHPAVLVGPPVGGSGATVEAFARKRGWRILPPPAVDRLLADPSLATTALAGLGEEPVALPALERMFVRTPAGLGALRDLTRCLLARRAPTLAACSSWAWRFLATAAPLGTVFRRQLALEPLAAPRLSRWLVAERRAIVTEPDGRWVIGPDAPRGETECSPFLARLAAAAHGNPEIARAIWALALRRPRRGDEADGGLAGPAADLWVAPWGELGLPEAEQLTREELMLLQLVLVHEQIADEAVHALVPSRGLLIAAMTTRLASQSLLARVDGGCWRVPACAYPAVRRALAHHGFWLDTLGADRT